MAFMRLRGTQAFVRNDLREPTPAAPELAASIPVPSSGVRFWDRGTFPTRFSERVAQRWVPASLSVSHAKPHSLKRALSHRACRSPCASAILSPCRDACEPARACRLLGAPALVRRIARPAAVARGLRARAFVARGLRRRLCPVPGAAYRDRREASARAGTVSPPGRRNQRRWSLMRRDTATAQGAGRVVRLGLLETLHCARHARTRARSLIGAGKIGQDIPSKRTAQVRRENADTPLDV